MINCFEVVYFEVEVLRIISLYAAFVQELNPLVILLTLILLLLCFQGGS